jgi:hypothetical protein
MTAHGYERAAVARPSIRCAIGVLVVPAAGRLFLWPLVALGMRHAAAAAVVLILTSLIVEGIAFQWRRLGGPSLTVTNMALPHHLPARPVDADR